MQPISVTELTFAIKNAIEPKFSNLWLKGEVSNFKKHTSGHLYFSLKDSEAQITAVMFYGNAIKLKSLPKDGDQVTVNGDLSVYAARGNYQIVIRELIQTGLGELLLKLEQLKKEIHRRGWFNKEHKKPLPSMPKRIGIITSPTGAAIQDILKVLKRRFSGLKVLLNPVKVQGEGAAIEIARAIDDFNRFQLADVLILGRGGGSIEDLWAFNEEVVAKAVFDSRIPIICAVGHETDHCIAEYVADIRAPTPSAAAEMVIAEKAQLEKHIKQIESRLQHWIHAVLRQKKTELLTVERQPLFAQPYAMLGQAIQRVDHLKDDLTQAVHVDIKQRKLKLESLKMQAQALKPINQIIRYRQQFLALSQGIKTALSTKIKQLRQRIEHLGYTLQAIDPKNLLSKGYTLLFSEKDDSVITTVKSLHKHQKIKMLLADGQALGEVTEIIPENKP